MNAALSLFKQEIKYMTKEAMGKYNFNKNGIYDQFEV